MNIIQGLTYGHLAEVLRDKGFTEVIDGRGRTYTHPSHARLLLPPAADDEPVATRHFVAARGMMDDFGLMNRDAFELLLMRLAHRSKTTA